MTEEINAIESAGADDSLPDGSYPHRSVYPKP